MIPLPVIFALVSAVAGFTGAYFWQEANYERRIADIHSAHASQLAESTRDALARTVALQAAKDEAERAAKVRLAAVSRDAASARTALGMLHDAADSAIRSAQQSHSACQSVAATSTELLQQCSSRYTAVAEQADQWVNEVTTLREAWPRQ